MEMLTTKSRFFSNISTPGGYLPLCSAVLAPCVPEIITTRGLYEMMEDINQVKDHLENRPSLGEKNIIYKYLCEVAISRDDADHFLTQEFIPLAFRDLMEAGRKRHDDLYHSCSWLLYYFTGRYPDFVIQVFLIPSGEATPLYFIKALDVVTTNANMTISGVECLLSDLNTRWADEETNHMWRDLCLVINNCLLAISTSTQEEQKRIQPHLINTLSLLHTWRRLYYGEEAAEIIKKAILLIKSLLLGDTQTVTSLTQSQAAQNQVDIQLWLQYRGLSSDPELMLSRPSAYREFIKECAQISAHNGMWRHLFRHLRPLLHSQAEYNKLTSAIYLSELMAYPDCLSNNQAKDIIEGLLYMDHGRDIHLFNLLLDCIKTAVQIHPEAVSQLKQHLAEFLMEKICAEDSPSLTKIMETLISVLQLFKDTRCLAREIMTVTARLFNHQNTDIQLLATRLFWEAAKRCPSYPESPVLEIIKEHWLNIMLKLHSNHRAMSAAAVQCVRQCLPHLGWRPRVSEMQSFDTMEAIYQALAEVDLLKPMLLEATSSWFKIADGEALINHLCFLIFHLPHSALSPNDITTLWEGLQRGTEDLNPSVQQTARDASQRISQAWQRPSTVAEHTGYLTCWRAWWRARRNPRGSTHRTEC